MDENRGDAGVLQRAGQVRRGEVLVVPAEPHLGGDRDFHGVDHAADKRGGFVQFGHHGRAAADVADLADGAAHVDVNGRDAARFEHLRRVAHFLRHGAEELDGQRRVGGAGLDELEGLFAFLQQRAGVDQVGGAQADAADFAHDEAEGQVGVTRQRRKEQIRCQRQRAEAHALKLSRNSCIAKAAIPCYYGLQMFDDDSNQRKNDDRGPKKPAGGFNIPTFTWVAWIAIIGCIVAWMLLHNRHDAAGWPDVGG